MDNQRNAFMLGVIVGFVGSLLLLLWSAQHHFAKPCIPPHLPEPAPRKMLLKTTAYCSVTHDRRCWEYGASPTGHTAMGSVARPGVCAADWRVLPPGTRLHIPGYGRCVVEDKGGGVKGAHVDVYLPSYPQARAWGVQHLETWVYP